MSSQNQVKNTLIFQPPPAHLWSKSSSVQKEWHQNAWTLLVIADFPLRVAEVPICHLLLSREVSCLLGLTLTVSQRRCHTWRLPGTHTLPHRVKLGCNKEFAKYQEGLHILQKDVEGISTMGSALLYIPSWKLATQQEDEWNKRTVDSMAGAMLRVLASMI